MRRFRINIPNSKSHILVKICKDKQDFDRHITAFGLKDINAYGVCIGLTHEDYRKGKCIKSDACMVFLIEDQIGAGYVAHELTHAILYLARLDIKRLMTRHRFWEDFKSSDLEEHICDITAWIHRGFWTEYYKKK